MALATAFGSRRSRQPLGIQTPSIQPRRGGPLQRQKGQHSQRRPQQRTNGSLDGAGSQEGRAGAVPARVVGRG